jgi:putative transposase
MNWLGQIGLMSPDLTTYPGYRFPAEIISHAVWLYHVFSLSLRDVELILAERGVMVTHESIRFWCKKFGADFARKLRRRRPKPGVFAKCIWARSGQPVPPAKITNPGFPFDLL